MAERLNRAIELLEQGQVVVSSSPIPNGSLEDAYTYGDSDFDMVVFEMEHHGFDFPSLRLSLQALMNRARIAADGLRPSVVPFVRLPPPGRETTNWIIKQALDIGVYGFLVPQLETPEEALAIIDAARYPARRGSDVGGGHRGYWPPVAARYWGLSSDEYVKRADLWPINPDGELLVIAIIESQRGVANLERILDTTNGIGAIWPGPGDLSADMGLVGQIQHPEVQAQLQHVLDVCLERGVPCVGVAVSLDDALRRVRQGFRIIFTRLQPGIAAAIRAERDRPSEETSG